MSCCCFGKAYSRLKIQEELKLHEGHSKFRDLMGFFICGLLNNFGYVVMLSAAEQLVPSSPAVVLLADILPSFIVQLTAPFYMARISYSIRICFITISAVFSFLIPAIFEPTWIRLIGVVLASISCGFGEITFLALTSHYHKNTVSSFSSGTGGAGILGSLFYLGLSYVFEDSKSILLVCSPIPLGMTVSYFAFISKRFVLQEEDTVPIYQTDNLKKDEVTDPATVEEKLSFFQQFSLMKSLLPYMIPLSIVYFDEYLINQGIDPVLTFSDAYVGEHSYEFYQAIYQVGVFISRSSVNFFPVRKLWVPALFQTINLALLSFIAIFNFVPTIYIIFVIIFWEGLLGGCIYVNTFYVISERFEGKQKEFCLGATSMSYGLSITLAAVTGIGYKPFLQHWRDKYS